MGQYHKTYNLDKKEFIHPYHIENGAKLYEQVAHISTTSTALFALLANSNGRGNGDFPKHDLIGHWAGNRILVQGDYAKEGDNGYVGPEVLEEFKDISEQVVDMLKTIEGGFV